jgi:AcrR family transcriptional regulator
VAPAAKTSRAKIVAAARAIIAERGVDALSLQQVATAVGVQAPSLYKRFDDRAALIAAVRDSLLEELADVLAEPATGRSGAAALRAMGHAYRAFAHRLGRLYPLLFAAHGAPSPAALKALAPLMTALDTSVGGAQALPAARTLTAFLHGFLVMEMSASFQMGGSIDDAFAFGLASVITGVTTSARPSSLPADAEVGTVPCDGP